MTPIPDDEPTTFTFETSHHALWAEDLAQERGIAARMVPAPSEADSKCGLALRIEGPQAMDLEGALQEEGIRYRRWDASSS